MEKVYITNANYKLITQGKYEDATFHCDVTCTKLHNARIDHMDIPKELPKDVRKQIEILVKKLNRGKIDDINQITIPYFNVEVHGVDNSGYLVTDKESLVALGAKPCVICNTEPSDDEF